MDRGYERMTVDDVAEQAGVGKATVYRRYPSKEDLAHDAFAHIIDVEVPEPDTGSLRGDMVAAYRSTLEFAQTPAGAKFLRMVGGEAARNERTAELYREMYQRRKALGSAKLQRAIDAGELRADADIEQLVDALPALLLMRAIYQMPMPPPGEAERMVDALLYGLAGR
jgi:AcrR family transcriptional regulator